MKRMGSNTTLRISFSADESCGEMSVPDRVPERVIFQRDGRNREGGSCVHRGSL